ncbi:serine/threonine-protein kinase [Tengunoibacter tsumagoiensis]|uniref:Protein kinase domain-containing protein n=1 Tax=Tengunoibacter tsumagoiensis TaxID=2014871 RepID=A0A402A5N6_9CHLR|nr:serine/threonine-protein kinase [Tengunoibacter tsumagoiensis]GCE14453.1 hypothetical protein KTT_43120 [Tengunoibacter tsumagoiensis]
MVDRIGQQVGSYQLVRLIGQGGFADVYLGQHQYLDRQAAIKLLQAKLTQQDHQTFLKEARTIADLTHPHIVHVIDFGVTTNENVPFLVMDYAPNGTIRQRYPQGARLPLNEVVSYVKQVADALQYAHNKGIIHRDVKPENMLLGPKGEILLSDFGIAVVSQSSRYQSGQEVGGTIAYMAPEQLQGKPRPASDQYALGVVVYELLSGVRPFNGSFAEIGSQHIFAPLPPLSEKVENLPPIVEQVISTALAKDPQQRFGSIQAFANALEQASIAMDGPTQSNQSMAPTYRKPDAYPVAPPPPLYASFNTPGNQTPPPPPGMSPANPYSGYGTPSGAYPPVNPGQPSGAYPPVNPGQPSGAYPPVPPVSGAQGNLSGQPLVVPAAPSVITNTSDTTMQIPAGLDLPKAEPAPKQTFSQPIPPKKPRSNFGYIAIIVVLVLLLIGGGSAWAYTTFLHPSSGVALNTVDQTNHANATATSSASLTATANVQISPTLSSTPTSIVTPTATATSPVTQGVTATATASKSTPVSDDPNIVYNGSTQNLKLTCISSCDKVSAIIKSIEVDGNTSTMTWHFLITNTGNSVCSYHAGMSLEDPNGVVLDVSSGTLSEGAQLDVGQSLQATAIFSSLPKQGIIYHMKSYERCGYYGGDNRIVQFEF